MFAGLKALFSRSEKKAAAELLAIETRLKALPEELSARLEASIKKAIAEAVAELKTKL